MKVSVCIPSFNLAPYIGQAIQSVLDQTFQDFELLIEDDASPDDSLKVIESFNDPRIKVFRKDINQGANWTTNNLVSKAQGEYIALLAADDIWVKDKLQKEVDYLDQNPETGIVFGFPRFIDSSNNELKYSDAKFLYPANRTREQWKQQFFGGNCLFISTSMYRRSFHDEFGGFDVGLPILADMEWYVRICGVADIHVMQEHLADIRMRDDKSNLSAYKPEVQIQSAYDMEKVHARHYKHDGKRRLMIATPFYEVRGWAPYIESLVKSTAALAIANIEFVYVQLSGDSYVWRARDQIAQTFLDSDCSELIFIDSDEGWDLEGFLRLVKADVDIVGGAYPVKNNWEHYGVTIYTDEESNTPKVREDGLIYADKVPTGFMKIHRRVFEKLKESYPDNWYWHAHEGTLRRIWNHFGHMMEDHMIYGEDISFCRRWQKTGGELFVEPRIKMSHMGVKSWHGEYHDFLCRQPGGSRDPLLKEAA